MSDIPQIYFAVNRLRMVREEVNRESLASACANMEFTRAFLSNLENHRGEPRLSTLLHICSAYQIPIDRLFWGCPDSSGACRIPRGRELSRLAYESLTLNDNEVRWLVRAGHLERLWLAISVTYQNGNEDQIQQYHAWVEAILGR